MKSGSEAAASVMGKALSGQQRAFEKCLEELGGHCARLQREREELLEMLKCMVLARRDNGDESAGLRAADALIARIEGGNAP